MNFLKRVLTALILLPLLIGVIELGGFYLSAALVIIAVLVCDEIFQMARPKANPFRSVFWLSVGLSMLVMVFDLSGRWAFIGPWALLFFCGVLLTFRPQMALVDIAKNALVVLISVYVMLSLTSIAYLRHGVDGDEILGRSYIYLALICTFSNDTFAYVVGRRFGKHKLFEAVSGKKTWEGFFAGALGCVLMPFVVGFLFRLVGVEIFPGLSLVDMLFVSLGISFLGPLGDLIESRIKRAFAVKDSGALLPGHGGIFDRIDAVLVTLPFTLGYAFFLSRM